MRFVSQAPVLMDSATNTDPISKTKVFSILSDGIDSALRTIVPKIIKTHHCAGFPLTLRTENEENKNWVETHCDVVKHYERRQKTISMKKKSTARGDHTENAHGKEAVEDWKNKEHSKEVVDDAEKLTVVSENAHGDGTSLIRPGSKRSERKRKNRIVYEESSSDEDSRATKQEKVFHTGEKIINQHRTEAAVRNGAKTTKHNKSTMFDRLARVAGCEDVRQGTRKYELLKDWIERDQGTDLMLSNDVIIWMKSQMRNDAIQYKERSQDEKTGRKKRIRYKRQRESIKSENMKGRMKKETEASACVDTKETCPDKAKHVQEITLRTTKRNKMIPVIKDEDEEVEADINPDLQEVSSVQNHDSDIPKEAHNVLDIAELDSDKSEELNSNPVIEDITPVHNSDESIQETILTEAVTEQDVEEKTEEADNSTVAKPTKTTGETFSLDDPDVFVVESILQERTTQNKRNSKKGGLSTYLVKWEGYDEVTWEPEVNLPKWIIRSYRARQKLKTKCKHVFDSCGDRKVVENKTAHTSEVIYHVWWKNAKEPDWESKASLPALVVKALEKKWKAKRLSKKRSAKKSN